MPFPTRQGHLLSSVHLRWLVQPSQEDLYYYWRNRFVPVSFTVAIPSPNISLAACCVIPSALAFCTIAVVSTASGLPSFFPQP